MQAAFTGSTSGRDAFRQIHPFLVPPVDLHQAGSTGVRVTNLSKQNFNSAGEAEVAFYEALARSDLEAMMSVWSEDEEVVCIHPDGGRLVGLANVRESWRQLFSGGVRLVVQTTQLMSSTSMLLTVHSVLEHVNVEGEESLQPPLVATNVYMRGGFGWKMVLHHASATPEVLETPNHANPHTVH